MSRTHNTSIAKSRLGPPRFGRRENDPPGPVRVYRLSPEELARYGPVTPPEKAERIRFKHRGCFAVRRTQIGRPAEEENGTYPCPENALENDRNGVNLHEKEAVNSLIPVEEMSPQKTPEKEEKPVETTEQPIREEAPARTSLARLREALTKEEYLRLKAEGKADRDIISELGTHPATFYALKREWGLVGRTVPPTPKRPAEEKPASPAGGATGRARVRARVG